MNFEAFQVAVYDKFASNFEPKKRKRSQRGNEKKLNDPLAIVTQGLVCMSHVTDVCVVVYLPTSFNFQAFLALYLI